MLRQLRPAITSVVAFILLFGVAYPLVVTLVAQVAFHSQANGSLVMRGNQVIGSSLIGQAFTGPGYFHPRPSAAGDGYDAMRSGGTNLGPTSRKLIEGDHSAGFAGVRDLAAGYRTENRLAAEAPVPADAVTRSASGLDPHISPANARIQCARVALARGLPQATVDGLVAHHTEGRSLGFLGEPRVNVLILNLDLDRTARPRGVR